MERIDYRDNLEMILQHFQNRRLLRAFEVAAFLGIDARTARKRYSFRDGYISAATLARELCSEKRSA